MRGQRDPQAAFFYSISPEQLVPPDHPLRAIRKLADDELARMSAKFDAAYSRTGRPGVPPEMLVKATLLQALYSIRSERQLCEQIGYNLLFRWFLGLQPDAPVWDHSTFTHARQRFMEHGLMQTFFDSTVAKGIASGAASNEHFSVDGTLIQSIASLKSFKPKAESKDDRDGPPPGDSNGWQDFKGEKRCNDTHQSVTDPEAKLYRKGGGKEALLCHSMHVLMDNRSAMLMAVDVDEANGRSEREAAVRMVKHVRRRHWVKPRTLGADAGYRGGGYRDQIEGMGIEAHVAKEEKRSDPVRHRASMVARRGIEKTISWVKMVGGLKRSRTVGRWKLRLSALAAGAAYNLLRLANLKREHEGGWMANWKFAG